MVLGPAQPPWFHDPLSFLGLSFIGSMLEAMMLAVLIALMVGAVKLGDAILKALHLRSRRARGPHIGKP